MAVSTPYSTQGPEGLSLEDTTNIILDLDIKPKNNHPNSERTFSSRLNLPAISTATATTPYKNEYITKCAAISAYACLSDPLTVQFQIEKPDNDLTADPPPTNAALLPIITDSNIARLEDFLARGSIVVEAANFAATACWVTPAHDRKPTPMSEFDTMAREGYPLIAYMLREIEIAKQKHLYPLNKPYWDMYLLARDPRREYVPGAVRAVIEPFLRAADEDQLPVWLHAGNPSARDVYLHFGFEIVESVRVGGVDTWSMMRPCRARDGDACA